MPLHRDVKNAAKGSIHGSIVALVGAVVTYCLITVWERGKRR